MGRTRDGKQRKEAHTVSLEPDVAEHLRFLGDGSIGAGISMIVELMRNGGQLDQLMAVRAEREAAHDAAKIEAYFTTYASLNAMSFRDGKPLTEADRIPECVRDRVLADALKNYGWSSGRKPFDLAISPAVKADKAARAARAAAAPAAESPRQAAAATDYDSVFGDTVSRPAATTADAMLAGTQDCWRCAAPVPVTHMGACPVCEAASPHGIRQPGEASADEMRAAALAEDDAKEFERHAIRDCWNCHIGLPVVPALARCPECGAVDPCGEAPVHSLAAPDSAADEPPAPDVVDAGHPIAADLAETEPTKLPHAAPESGVAEPSF